MNEIKVTLPQLLSLYTGGRPVGIRSYSEQYDEFFENYGQLMYIDLLKFKGKQLEEAEKLNFRNLSSTIELQYPALKKVKKTCKEYMKKVPAMYDDNADENIIQNVEYRKITTELMKETRKALGKDSKFVVKNLRAFSR